MGWSLLLKMDDPVFRIEFRYLMLAVGVAETIVAIVCLFSKNSKLPLILIAWLATTFFIYRVGMLLLGWRRPCPCLGYFTDAVHVPATVADYIAKIILIYLFIGSYATLLWLWRQRKKTSAPIPA